MMLLISSGVCAQDEAGAAKTLHRHLWEDFEQRRDWEVVPTEAPVLLRRSEMYSSTGYYALEAKTTGLDEMTFVIRRASQLDLTHMKQFSLDVFNGGDAAKVSLVFYTTEGSMRFETPAVVLSKGWNRGVTFALDGRSFRTTQGGPVTELAGREDVRAVGLAFQLPRRAGASALYLDNLAFLGDASEPWKPPVVRIDSVTEPPLEVPQYNKVELRVRFSGVVTEYFDPDALNLYASVRTPSGRTFRMPGFLGSLEERPPKRPEPVWLIRFSPTEAGRYELTVTVEDGRSSASQPVRSFTCTKAESGRGFVRISPRDGRFFEFDDGTLFYPIGQNVCWSRDYESYFRRMHAAGENFVRVWICPWNCWLERTDSLGRYDLDAAGRIDDILALAEKYDLYVQLVIVWHGMLSSDAWGRNPYNAANGGPCATAADFFTDAQARALFQRKLRYLVARYSWSPRLFAWELANEIDLGEHRDWTDIVDWHRDMAHCLLRLDPHRDLVTTSAFNPLLERRLYALPEITFGAPHRYSLDAVDSVRDVVVGNLVHGKPVFLAEFGSDTTREGQSEVDPGGVGVPRPAR